MQKKEVDSMKLVIIRHGDPDYVKDSLTPEGWKEAQCLADRLEKMEVKDFYVSPLGRAVDTAKVTLERMGRSAQVLPWLREFPVQVECPNLEHNGVCWDWLPQDWTAIEEFFDKDKWMQPRVFRQSDMEQTYKTVTDSLDELLEKHGYVRNGYCYRAVAPNTDTLVFFCHFGLECVLLSHLLNISPVVLWHGTCAAPTSVTVLNTEERREGIAYFRMSMFGDISHLYAADREPSFQARFCEVYSNKEQRH